MRFALGGYRLLARNEFADSAAALLESLPNEQEDDDAATRIDRSKRNWLWLPIAFAMAFPFVPGWGKGWVRVLRIFALVVSYPMLAFVLF